MPQMTFNVSSEEYTKLLEEAKNRVRSEITEAKVEEYLRNNSNFSIEAKINNLASDERYKTIKNTLVKDLSGDELLILMNRLVIKGLYDF
jgi:DNA-directed RNA polymerase beta' subunit